MKRNSTVLLCAGMVMAGGAVVGGWALLPSGLPSRLQESRVRMQVGPAAKSVHVAPVRAAKMAAVLPEEIAAWSRSKDDPATRQQLLAAALRAWGARDLVAAVAWSVELDDTFRTLALEAALAGGASVRPEFAVQVARELLAADPSVGGPPVSGLIGALSGNGRFDLALQLALTAPPEVAANLTATAFAAWARQSPEAALTALGQVSDESLRHAAMSALIQGWAATDPAGLAARADTAFSGEDRGFAMRQAIASWADKDVGGLALWLDTLPAGAERDSGAAAAAEHLAKNDPHAAFAWTEKISDADGRFRSLQRVATAMDRSVARVYVDRIDGIDPAERSAVLRQLDCSP